MKTHSLQNLLQPVLAVLTGLAFGLGLTAFTGESPWLVLQVLTQSAVGSPYDLGMTLFYSTPLILTGLAVALPLRVGLFNVGAEGQMLMGCLAAAAVSLHFPHLPIVVAPVVAGFSGAVAGAFWGAIPGWLRARRGSHEVITTIMLNFVAAGWASWVVLYPLKNPETANPETRLIPESFRIPTFDWAKDTPLGWAIVLALVFAAVVYVLLQKTVWGYRMRAVGENERAAAWSGIDSGKARWVAMAFGGALAGLVCLPEVLGGSFKFKTDFSPGYGAIGIAVALLARGNPVAVVPAALLFGALHKGTADLDIETDKVTRDVSLLIQASVILFASADGLWTWMKKEKGKAR